MSESDFTPGINDPAKQHFIDASLEELRRLGTGSPDQDFLKTMDKALDQVDAEIKFPTPDSKSKFVFLKNHIVIGAIAALLFIGLFTTVHFSRKIEEIDLALNTDTEAEAIDKYNSSARRNLTEVEHSRLDYYDVARDETRSKFLRETAEEWEQPIDATIDVTGSGDNSIRVGGEFQGLDQITAVSDSSILAQSTPSPPSPVISGKELKTTSGLSLESITDSYAIAGSNEGLVRANGDHRANGRATLSTGTVSATDNFADVDSTSSGNSLLTSVDKPAQPKVRGLTGRSDSKPTTFSTTLLPQVRYNGGSDGLESMKENDVLYGGVSLSVDFGEPAAPVSGPVKSPQILAREEAAKNQNHPADLAKVPSAPLAPAQKSPAPQNEKYGELIDNAFQSPLSDPLSTFSVDVDTASYSNIRRMVNGNIQIPTDSVRIEEMINYFAYDYPQPAGEHPFAFAVETADCPWNGDHQLMRVGIQGKSMDRDKRPAANLVFLLDVSGSMSPTNKLPLVKQSMGLMIEELTEKDTISVVVYAGAEGLCLPPTSGDQKQKILQSLNNLQSGGSTNGGAGIQLAYKLAKENFKPDGINRVILCTDGDFNVGKTDEGDLTTMVEKKAKDGTFLSVLGFGSGNINDSMLESITNKGNGNYFYIDTLKEGRKVLLQDLMSTLVTIAKDVKIQIEFNPKHVQHYRLIGYANRMLKAEDFENDKIDAGEIGAGHAVTALYEIVPAGAPPIQRKMSNLKYQQPVEPKAPKMKLVESDELCTLKLRYKLPKSDKSTPIELPVTYQSREWKEASNDYQFSAAVALWGMLLREGEHCGKGTVEDVLEMAKEGTGADPFGRRAELIELVKKWNKTAALTGKAENANDAFHSGVEISVDF
ncbi:MAG: VWA domain-containing protein [Verrucomicrobiales bacterium]|nr:VWA domain-containing protein [Verrucomicrobiales bacterium]